MPFSNSLTLYSTSKLASQGLAKTVLSSSLLIIIHISEISSQNRIIY